MIYTLYLDEANTHGPAPDIIMAGFLGSAREWDLMLRRLRGLQREYGFTIFHATDFVKRRDEFRGWSQAKRSELVGAFARAVRDNLSEGLTITLPHKQFVEEYRDVPPERGEMQLSQFGLCVGACLGRAIEIIRNLSGNHRLNVVVEKGHKNAGAAKTVFDAIKNDLEAQEVRLLGEIAYKEKFESEALMLADFQAYATLLSNRREQAGLPGYNSMAQAEPRARNAGLTTIFYRPGTLRAQKARKAEIAKTKRTR